MTNINTSQSDWEECKAGSLVRYAAREQSRIRRRRITKLVGVVAVCLVAVFASTTLLQPDDTGLEPNYGGIVCSKVMINSKSYLAGTIDKDMNSKIELHLKLCPKCRSWISQQRKSQASNVSQGSYRQRYVSAKTGQASE